MVHPTRHGRGDRYRVPANDGLASVERLPHPQRLPIFVNGLDVVRDVFGDATIFGRPRPPF
jgi:hypothetical protein